MTPNLTLVLTSAALVGTGTYLFLSRSLVRALMGFLLLGNGINLLFLIASGPAGAPPVVGAAPPGEPMSDPVPQALVLTAIVITLGMTAFVLALAHRGRQLSGVDLIGDDTESARIHARAEADDPGSGPSARETSDQIEAEGRRTESSHHAEVPQGREPAGWADDVDDPSAGVGRDRGDDPKDGVGGERR